MYDLSRDAFPGHPGLAVPFSCAHITDTLRIPLFWKKKHVCICFSHGSIKTSSFIIVTSAANILPGTLRCLRNVSELNYTLWRCKFLGLLCIPPRLAHSKNSMYSRNLSGGYRRSDYGTSPCQILSNKMRNWFTVSHR